MGNEELAQSSLLLEQEIEGDQIKSERASGKRANDLDGATWTKNSISIWSDIRKTPDEAKLGHPAIFPMQLARRFIESFTTSADQVILDPFAGVGSTVIAADRLGKTGIGFELSEKFADIARTRLGQKDMFASNLTESIIYCEDTSNLPKFVLPGSVDMVVTSPPYWNILNQKRTADNKVIRHYGNAIGDLGTIEDYEEFLDALAEVFRLVFAAMKPQKYCVVVVMDLRKKDKFFSFHSDLASILESKIGFIFDDMIIWDRRAEYNNLKPLGYPAVFRVNRAHEFCLIFKKPEGRNDAATASTTHIPNSSSPRISDSADDV